VFLGKFEEINSFFFISKKEQDENAVSCEDEAVSIQFNFNRWN
jgi:hypothetical protein